MIPRSQFSKEQNIFQDGFGYKLKIYLSQQNIKKQKKYMTSSGNLAQVVKMTPNWLNPYSVNFTKRANKNKIADR